jgi:transcriptional regulator
MYIPDLFARHDVDDLRALMRDHGFATLVTVADGEPFASHLPLLWVDDGSTHGVIVGHVARANPQWRHFASRAPAVAMFAGPHAYVSPTWYATADQVPTWNYAAVHAYGVPRALDPAGARAVLDRLVARHEDAWQLDRLPAAKQDALIAAIVAFEMPIARLEGKWKVGQNRKPEDRRRAAEHLATTGAPDATAIAKLMLDTLARVP